MDNEMKTNTEIPKNEEETAFGPIIGILIIVIVLAIGGFYFWKSSLHQNIGELPLDPNYSGIEEGTTAEEYTMTDAEFDALLEASSDETADIILDTTLDDLSDLDSLDAELAELEEEL